MVLDNSGYLLWFEFLIPCCVLISLLLMAGMGTLLGLPAEPLGGFGLEIRAGTPRVGCEPRELAEGVAQHSFKGRQVLLGSSRCFALQAGVKM